MSKPIIYQLLPRLYTNINNTCIPNGTAAQNGVGKLDDITDEVIASIRELGATHIWLTGVLEHATTTAYPGIPADHPKLVKGRAGSPYAIRDYYDIDPDLAEVTDSRQQEFDALVERIHRAGMKVVIDFVPNHVARSYRSDSRPEGAPSDFGHGDDTTLYFGRDNNFYYIPRQQLQLPGGNDGYEEFPAKATGNDAFTAFPSVYDWYETAKLNYGIDYGDHTRHFSPVPSTWHKMLHILHYWADRGVDAFRCDMAHMVPLEFWHMAIADVKRRHPQLRFIAEIYDVALYRPYIEYGGFDWLYDKVNLYDKLRAVDTAGMSAAQLTSAWQTVEGIGGNMLNFLENHDEQRYGSPQYAGDPARVFAPLTVSATLSTGPMMIYMGQELGEQGTDAEGYSGRDGRTTIFDYWSLPTLRRWLSPDGRPDNARLTPAQQALRQGYATLLRLCNSETAIARGAFFDLMYVNYADRTLLDPHRHYAYLRCDTTTGDTLLVVANFADHAADITVNIPAHALDTLGLRPSAAVNAVELLTGTRQVLPFTPAVPVSVTVPRHGAVIWKFPLKKRTHKPKKA